MNRDEMIELLKQGTCEVTFNKINGDERVMTCTLHESQLPEQTSTGNVRPINEHVISAWDVNAAGWRSFRVENVTKFSSISG